MHHESMGKALGYIFEVVHTYHKRVHAKGQTIGFEETIGHMRELRSMQERDHVMWTWMVRLDRREI